MVVMLIMGGIGWKTLFGVPVEQLGRLWLRFRLTVVADAPCRYKPRQHSCGWLDDRNSFAWHELPC